MTQPKKQSLSDNCLVCGSKLVSGTYDHVLGGEHVEHQVSGEIRWTQHVILGVPALICRRCGSPWVRADDGVLEKLQTYAATCAAQGVFVSTVNYLAISPTTH